MKLPAWGRGATWLALALLAAHPAAASSARPVAARSAGLVAARSASPVATALARGDSAWSEGRFAAARTAYEAVIAADSLCVRANYKLAVLESREDRLAPALLLIRRARAVEPMDPELTRTEARILAWSGRYAEADTLYAQALARAPDDPGSRLEVARLRMWENRRDEARAELARSLALDPANLDALKLQRELRSEVRPRVELGVVYASDSDENASWSRTFLTSMSLAQGLRGFVRGGSLSATDPTLEGSRMLGEAGLDLSHGTIELVAAAGARWLSPQGLSSHSEPCYRAALSWRAVPPIVVGAGFAHYPLDETALLIGRRIDLDEFEGNLDARLGRHVSLGAGGGAADLSDGNRRASGMAALTATIRDRASVGILARTLSYAKRITGYFSPDRFNMAEARASVGWTAKPCTGRLGGGLGVQRVGRGAATQAEWHAETRLAFGWAAANQIELSVGASNSATSSTTGAYRYFTSALTVRAGL